MNYSEPLIPCQFYHLFNHAVGDDNLFREEANYNYFLKKYSEYIYPVCKTYCYCLMPNHFHLLVQIREDNEFIDFYREKYKNTLQMDYLKIDLSKFVIQQFSNFFNSYAKSYNKRFGRKGALFIDYMKRKVVKNEEYLVHLINYIHKNPIHHGFCKDIGEWEYSSYNSLLSVKSTKLEKTFALNLFGGREDFIKFHSTENNQWKEMKELEFNY